MTLEEIDAQVAPQDEAAQPTAEEAAPQGTEEQEQAEKKAEESIPGQKDGEAEPDPLEIVKHLPKKTKTAAERIAEMTWKQREAERQAEYWREQAMGKKTPEAAPSVPTGRPRIEQYQTLEDYEDALVDWNYTQRKARETEEKTKEEQAQALTSFNVRATKLREIHEDFDEVVQAPVFTPVMREVLLRSEQGPVMAYYLGRPENITVAQKIASLPPQLQPYEIGRLETRLLIAQKTRKVTGAPPPIEPVGSTGAPNPVDESKLTDDEWFRLERQRTMDKLKKKYGG